MFVYRVLASLESRWSRFCLPLRIIWRVVHLLDVEGNFNSLLLVYFL